MKQLTGTILLLFFLAMVKPASGQEQEKCKDNIFNDPLLEKMTGVWNIHGQIGKDKITYHFRASWELNHQFIGLVFSDTAAKPEYTAQVFIGYDCISERSYH